MSARSSFYWPLRLVPEPQRSALFAVYAWCRHMDDIIDGPLLLEKKADALAQWRDFFSDHAGPTPMDQESVLLATALGAAIAAHKLPPRIFLNVLDGMEMDLAGEMRGPTLAQLEIYAHAVASAPGEACLNILGWRDSSATAFAHALGEAMQYTNILRDVTEDAELGRLYIPREALDSAGIDAEDPSIVLADARFSNAWLALGLMAEAKFHLAETLLPKNDVRSRIRPVLAMAHIYRALWDQLRRRGWKRDAPKSTFPTWRAALMTLRTAWFG